MEINYSKTDKTLIFNVSEDIDHHNTEEVRRNMDYEIERCIPKRVIFNFNNVTFMDSAGIGLLLGRYKLTKMLRRRSRNDKCKKFN